MTSCMPPTESKKRSKTSVSRVGKAPSAALAAARDLRVWRAAPSSRPAGLGGGGWVGGGGAAGGAAGGGGGGGCFPPPPPGGGGGGGGGGPILLGICTLTRPPLRVGHPLPRCGRGACCSVEREEAGIDF